MIIKFIKWTKESVHYEKNTRNTNNNEKKKFFQMISVKVAISAWFESMLLLITLERNY